MATVNITVDGKELEAQAGQMLIEVTDQAGIHIPRFCYHPKLSIAANCRMCLVEVERAPKPLPACATPVMDGMIVQTQSELAQTAQEGTMEFLLINHPLDCPICDQGGECPLQDQSVGYGKNDSRYEEPKRQVSSEDIGPLIATWMTRCIHCTRCVRFGEEIGGVMELGMIGRGEHSEIATFPDANEAGEVHNPVNGALSQNQPNRFVESGEHNAVDAYLSSSVNSELSGNVIELCPVGALTAKPSKYAGRSWELENHASISPHDCVGSNINIQTLRGEIKRSLVRENDSVNTCWLSDRDRYSYESALSDNRLQQPMIKDQHGWREVDWDTALKHAAAGLKTVINRSGEESIGALASPTATVEELFLVQKLMRGLGSSNVDHRLHQQDFRGDSQAPAYPGSELAINEFVNLDSVLLVGSNIRKEQPILGLFLRQAVVKNSAKVCAINSVDYDFHFDVEAKSTVAPNKMVGCLAAVASEIAKIKGVDLAANIASRVEENTEAKAIAESLLNDSAESKAIIYGSSALAHSEMCTLLAIGDWLADATGAKIVRLPQANAAGAWLAGCVPHRGPHGEHVARTGLNAKRMVSENEALRAYVLYGVEPGLDMHRSGMAMTAMEQADFVIQCTPYVSDEALTYADVLLPIANYAEQSGTYINCQGTAQGSRAATKPLGEARPGWKVLRVMGNYFDVAGFDHVTIEDVQDEYVLGFEGIIPQRGMGFKEIPESLEEGKVNRICETPMYRIDQSLRHAAALQTTADNPAPALGLNKAMIEKLGLSGAARARVSQGGVSVELAVKLDARLPDDCAFVPAGHLDTAALAGVGQLDIEACA
ncbi:MAG: NADH-quinone oxidoreductase subunit G [Saprospiraceae bacterium]|jgi:NADH-quinone oxidoreductase subunit G